MGDQDSAGSDAPRSTEPEVVDEYSDVSPPSDDVGDGRSRGGQPSKSQPDATNDDPGRTGVRLAIAAPPGIPASGAPVYNSLTLPAQGSAPQGTGPPMTSMATASAPLDAWVEQKLKDAIWEGAYVSMGALTGEAALPMALNVDAHGGLCFAPPKKPALRTFDQWLKGFLIYMAIYLQRRPLDAPKILKHVDTVRDLHACGARWEFYDESVRRLRTSAPWPWELLHMEYWGRAMAIFTQPRWHTEQTGRVTQRDPPSAKPRGVSVCFAFNKDRPCSRDCEYAHSCAACGGAHSKVQCRRANDQGSGRRQNRPQRKQLPARLQPQEQQRQPFRAAPLGDANMRQ